MASEHVFEITEGTATYRMYLPLSGSDHIQRYVARTGTAYERTMLADIASRVPPGRCVLDIGANVGNHTMFLACVAGLDVWSFEPNAQLAHCIGRSAELNGVTERVHVQQVALGASEQLGRLVVDDQSNLGGAYIQLTEQEPGAIQVRSVDSLELPAGIAAVKIDVEGMELAVLAGAAELIARDRPLLYIESLTAEEYEAVSAVLRGHGYRYWATFNDSPTHLYVPAEQISAEDARAWEWAVGLQEYQHRAAAARARTRVLDAAARAATLQVEVKRIAKQRAAALREVATIRASTTYQVGISLRDAARNPARALALPRTWWRLARGRAARRRQAN